MGKEEKMVEAQKAYSQEKVKYAKEVVDTMIENGEAVTPYSVWKKSGLSKAFIYTNEDVKTYISKHRSEKEYNYRQLTQRDLMQERIDYLEREVTALRKELKYYKQASYEALVNENQILQHRLNKYLKLEEQGLIKLPDKEN